MLILIWKILPIGKKHQGKKLDSSMKMKLNRKRIYPSIPVKYLGIKIDENLNWKKHIHDIAIKINKAMLYYLQLEIVLQKKALRIMNFQSRDSQWIPLFKSEHILKLESKILTENIRFINNSFNNLFSPICRSLFIFCSGVQNYQTVPSTSGKIFKPSYRTDSYGKNWITIGAINSWNKTQHQFNNLSLKKYNPTRIKILLLKKCIENYWWRS